MKITIALFRDVLSQIEKEEITMSRGVEILNEAAQTGLKNELKLKIEECNMLHDMLHKRPIEIKHQCDVVSYDDHVDNAKILQQKIDNKEEFYVNARKNDGVLTIRPFAYGLYDDLDGLFYGIVVNVENCPEVDIFDFAEFGCWSLFNS